MVLADIQSLLARLFTDGAARRAFFENPEAFARAAGLGEAEARKLAGLDRREVESFAQTLLGKRAQDARKVLPLTAAALGERFNAQLFAAIEGPSPPGRHREDAAALARRLSAQDAVAPPWIGDLARYELAFIEASRPGAGPILRRFQCRVDEIARRLRLERFPIGWNHPIDKNSLQDQEVRASSHRKSLSTFSELALGATPVLESRLRFGLWLRLPGGRFVHKMFG